MTETETFSFHLPPPSLFLFLSPPLSSPSQDFFQVTTFLVSDTTNPRFSSPPTINQSGLNSCSAPFASPDLPTGYLSFNISNAEPVEGSTIEFDLVVSTNLYDANLSSSVQSLTSRVRVVIMGRPLCPVQVGYKYAGSLAVEISWTKDETTVLACQQNKTSKTVRYQIYLTTQGQTPISQSVSSNCSVVQSARITGLTQGRHYQYQVVGLNLVGRTCSPLLDPSGSTFLALATPSPPRLLEFSRLDVNTINMSWSVPADTGDGTANRQLISAFHIALDVSSSYVISTAQTSVLLRRQSYPLLFDASSTGVQVFAINVVGAGASESQTFSLVSAACPQVCGDGLKLPTEDCDDGNLVDGDGCSSRCKVEPRSLCNFSAPPAFSCEQRPQGPSSCFFPQFLYVKLLQSSTFPGSSNTIYFSFRANSPLASSPLHVKISGLTGTGTADSSSLPITLYDSSFHVDSAIWKQVPGELDLSISTNRPLDGELFLSFTLTNPSSSQPAVNARIDCINCLTCNDCSQSSVSLASFVNGSVLGVEVPQTDCDRRDGLAWFGPNCSLPCHGVVQVPPSGEPWCECASGSFGVSCEQVVKADMNLSVPPQLVLPSTVPVAVKGGDGDGVELPPGAILSSIVVSVQVFMAEPPIPAGQSDLTPVGKVMELKPDGVIFEEPVTISTAITDQAIAQARADGKVLEMRFLDRASGRWVSTGGQVAYINGAPFLLTKSLHFSLWAAMSGNPPPTTATNASETAGPETTSPPPPPPTTTTTPSGDSSVKVIIIACLAAGIPSILVILLSIWYFRASSRSKSKLYMAESRQEGADMVESPSPPPVPSSSFSDFSSIVAGIPEAAPDFVFARVQPPSPSSLPAQSHAPTSVAPDFVFARVQSPSPSSLPAQSLSPTSAALHQEAAATSGVAAGDLPTELDEARATPSLPSSSAVVSDLVDAIAGAALILQPSPSPPERPPGQSPRSCSPSPARQASPAAASRTLQCSPRLSPLPSPAAGQQRLSPKPELPLHISTSGHFVYDSEDMSGMTEGVRRRSSRGSLPPLSGVPRKEEAAKDESPRALIAESFLGGAGRLGGGERKVVESIQSAIGSFGFISEGGGQKDGEDEEESHKTSIVI
eukprot:759439-Hanusia_phi.AAC.5